MMMMNQLLLADIIYSIHFKFQISHHNKFQVNNLKNKREMTNKKIQIERNQIRMKKKVLIIKINRKKDILIYKH